MACHAVSFLQGESERRRACARTCARVAMPSVAPPSRDGEAACVFSVTLGPVFIAVCEFHAELSRESRRWQSFLAPLRTAGDEVRLIHCKTMKSAPSPSGGAMAVRELELKLSRNFMVILALAFLGVMCQITEVRAPTSAVDHPSQCELRSRRLPARTPRTPPA